MKRCFALLALALCAVLRAHGSADDDARDPAFEAYRKALVADLAKSSDARRLLAAGAFAAIDADPDAAKRGKELFARAAQAGVGDSIVQWVAALQSCEHNKPCAALTRFADSEADNAIAQLALMDRGAADALKHAGNAKRYDDYVWKIAQALYAVTGDGRASHDATRLSTSLGLALSVSMPPIDGLMRVCLRDKNPVARPDCLKVAHAMTAGDASVLSYRMGARLIAALSDDPAERDAWQAKLDEAGSLGERSNRAVDVLMSDAAGVEALTRAFTQSRDEMAFQRAVIIAAAARGN